MNNHKEHVDSSKWLEPCQNPEEVRNEFDRVAKNYDDDMQGKGYKAPEDATRMLTGLIPVEAKILDAGCGTGLLGVSLHRQGFKNMTGLDFSAECLKEAGKKTVYSDLVNSSLLEKLPFEDNTFDAVICIGVLLRFVKSEFFAILDEFSRVCRKDGLIFFTYRADFMRKLNLLDDLRQHPRLVVEQVTDPCPIFVVDENMKDIYGHYVSLRNGK